MTYKLWYLYYIICMEQYQIVKLSINISYILCNFIINGIIEISIDNTFCFYSIHTNIYMSVLAHIYRIFSDRFLENCNRGCRDSKTSIAVHSDFVTNTNPVTRYLHTHYSCPIVLCIIYASSYVCVRTCTLYTVYRLKEYIRSIS